MHFLNSLRSRLLLLVLLATLPALFSVVWLTDHERENARHTAHNNALNLSLELVRQHEYQIESARQLLMAMAEIPAVQSTRGKACSDQLAALKKTAPGYLANFSVIQPDGQIECSALPLPSQINVADRAYFQEAMATGKLAVSGYQIGRISARPVLGVIHPATDDAGRVRFFVHAALDLSWVNAFWTTELLRRSELPAQTSLTVIDNAGTILVRHPEPDALVGWHLPDHPRVKEMLELEDGGTFEGVGFDNLPRYHIDFPLEAFDKKFGALSVGIPRDAVYAEVEKLRRQGLLTFSVVGLLLLALTWGFAERAILRRLQPLFARLQQIANGELPPRDERAHGPDELGRLAATVDNLAEQLRRDLDERTAREQQLRNSTALLRVIFRNAPLIIMVLDDQARVLETNLPDLASGKDDATAELPKLCGQVLRCAPQNHDGFTCGTGETCCDCPIRTGLDQVIATEGDICNREVSMALMDNGSESRCHFSLAISPLQGVDASRFLVTMIDITDRKHAENQRMEVERQLLQAQKMESLGILAGSLAHDFNNLLMAIIGHLDLARQRLDAESSALPNLAKALRASQQATGLTRQLLAYAGRSQFEIKPVDLRELVQANAELFQVSIGRAVSLQVVGLSGNLPLVMADSTHLQQVIMNLITNASEAIGEQPGAITLRLAVDNFTDEELRRSVIQPPPPAGRYLALEVADTGCGMDEETQRRMFEPFFTTKFTGRGLGMSATLGIVRELQGALLIDSAPGRGTIIRVLLPAVDEADPAATAARPDNDPADPVAFSGTMLIIDDEEVVRFITTEYAEMFGFDTLAAENGAEGVRLFHQHADRITCVLLDLTMPVMDGLETFRRIRQARPDAKVILSSGYIEREATERFFGEGLAGFIHKPYNKQDLRQKLVEVLWVSGPSAG